MFHEANQSAAPVQFPFAGLFAVLFALAAANIFQTISLLGQRSNLSQVEQRAEKMVPEARVLQGQIEPRLEAFSRDLVQMATTNDAARTLVTQFGITWNPNGNSTSGASAPASTATPSASAPADSKSKGR